MGLTKCQLTSRVPTNIFCYCMSATSLFRQIIFLNFATEQTKTLLFIYVRGSHRQRDGINRDVLSPL